LLRSYKIENDVDLVHSRHLDLFFTEPEENNAKADYEVAKASGIDINGIDFLTKDETAKVHLSPCNVP
jgi:hypothetical protein